MQNVMHIATNADHTAQNDGLTMQNGRFYRTSSEIVEEIILFQTTILSHTVLHSPDKYSQATNVQTSDIVCNKQLEIGCHEHCSSAI